MSRPGLRPHLLALAPTHGRAISQLLKTASLEYERDYARYFATAMVYYALISLVPLLVLLLAVLGILLRASDVVAAAEQQLLQAVAINFGQELRETIEQLSESLQRQSVIASIISVVGLLLAVSALVHHLRMSFRAVWKQAPPWLSGTASKAMWTVVREKIVAFLMVLTATVVMFVVICAVVALHWLHAAFAGVPVLGRATAWLLVVPGSSFILLLIFALLLRYLPPTRLPLRHVWFAAVLCASAWMIGVEILTLYGNFFGSNVSAYGAIGAILVIMLWVHTVGKVLFFGAEICKVSALSDADAAAS